MYWLIYKIYALKKKLFTYDAEPNRCGEGNQEETHHPHDNAE